MILLSGKIAIEEGTTDRRLAHFISKITAKVSEA